MCLSASRSPSETGGRTGYNLTGFGVCFFAEDCGECVRNEPIQSQTRLLAEDGWSRMDGPRGVEGGITYGLAGPKAGAEAEVGTGLEAGIEVGDGDGGGRMVAFRGGRRDGGGMSIVTCRDEAGVGVAAISRMIGMGPKVAKFGLGVVKEADALLDLVGVGAGSGRT